MTSGSSELLRALGAGVRPAAPDRPSAAARPGIEHAGFSDLLARVRSGGAMPVSVGPEAGIELTEDQLKRIADATDRAEAAGATRALVLIDGMALRVDVGVRSITGKADMATEGVLTGIDAVLQAAPSASAGGAQAARPPALGPGAALNASLLRALSGQPQPQG